jgi:hypothetical protein
MTQTVSLFWLAAGAVLIGADVRTPIPIGTWLALTFLLRAARTLPLFPGMASVALALYAALAAGLRGILPVPGLAYFAVVTGRYRRSLQ